MYTKYDIINGKILVFNEDGFAKNMKLTSNVKEILICENNIEEMKELIEDKKLKIKLSKKKKISKCWQHFPLASIWGANATLHITLNNNWLLGGIVGLNFFLNAGLGLAHIISENKYIKINKTKLDLINKYLRDEELKLIDLEQNSNKNLNYIEQSSIIEPSERISELKMKLDVLHDYMANRKHYIKHYIKGTLRYVIEYVKEEKFKYLEDLIKEDLKSNNQNENFNTKKLTKKWNYYSNENIKENDTDIIRYKQ